MIPTISQLPGQVSTVILLVLLILAFVVAFKVMKMVFQTILVSGLSAVCFMFVLTVFFLQQHAHNKQYFDVCLPSWVLPFFYMGYSSLISGLLDCS